MSKEEKLQKCLNCTEYCPQADMAKQMAEGRLYATNELIRCQKELESISSKDVDEWSLEDLELMYMTEYDDEELSDEDDAGDDVLNFLNWCKKNLRKLE